MKKMISLVFILCLTLSLFSYYGIGSDAAFQDIEKVMKSIPIEKNKIYECTDEDVEKLVSKAAEIQINIFELLDCTYRYLEKNKMRIVLKGSSFQKLTKKFDFGGETVMAVMPIHLLDKMYTGFCFEKNQKPLQIFLTQEYEKFIEIGTALYEKEFGFYELEPNLFYNSYGMRVKKFGIKLRVKKIHLYESGMGAVYARGIYKPKRLYLDIIKKL